MIYLSGLQQLLVPCASCVKDKDVKTQGNSTVITPLKVREIAKMKSVAAAGHAQKGDM